MHGFRYFGGSAAQAEGLGAKFGRKQNLTQKLRRIILLHFGSATLRTNFKKTRKPIILLVFGPGGRDHDSQNQ